jgi:hypothetical protein
LENLPSGGHLSAFFSHCARAHAPGILLQLGCMTSAARLKPPLLPPYPIWSEATIALISSSLLRSLPSPEFGPPLKQAVRMAPPPLPSSSNRLVDLTPDRAPIERLIAARTEHVAPRAAVETQSPHRPHHRAEPTEPCWPGVTASPRAFVYTGAAPRRRELAPCCRSPLAIAFLMPLHFSASRSCRATLELESEPGASLLRPFHVGARPRALPSAVAGPTQTSIATEPRPSS